MDPSPKDTPSSKKQPPEQASPQADLLPFEQHAAAQGLPAWQVAAVAAQKNWPARMEVSESDFQKALKETLKGVIE